MVRNRVAFPILAVVLAGCSYHTYGLTVTPAPAYGSSAQTYLMAQGFHSVPYAAGDELAMERQRGDSVDHVRLFHGGGSPASLNAYGLSGSGGGVYTGSSLSPGVSQAAVSPLSSTGYSSPAVSGPSRMLTVEMTTYRVDSQGLRHEVEPTSAVLDQLDALIARVAARSH